MSTLEPQLAYVVEVTDRVDKRLAGHAGGSYTSPPHSREQALALVRVLLGCPGRLPDTDGPWQLAIAGGQRKIGLLLADRLFV